MERCKALPAQSCSAPHPPAGAGWAGSPCAPAELPAARVPGRWIHPGCSRRRALKWRAPPAGSSSADAGRCGWLVTKHASAKQAPAVASGSCATSCASAAPAPAHAGPARTGPAAWRYSLRSTNRWGGCESASRYSTPSPSALHQGGIKLARCFGQEASAARKRWRGMAAAGGIKTAGPMAAAPPQPPLLTAACAACPAARCARCCSRGRRKETWPVERRAGVREGSTCGACSSPRCSSRRQNPARRPQEHGAQQKAAGNSQQPAHKVV